MPAVSQIVISASRRTDIPAHYMDWFMKQINRGWFDVINPYNRRISTIPATPEKIHTIVFWSKNFGPFLELGYGEKLTEMGYNLFFNFTINSDSSLLEPNVPHLKKRINQLEYLTKQYGKQSITWRFDPVCLFKMNDGKIQDNLKDFSVIALEASRFGVERCVTSFIDLYPKIQKRLLSIPDFVFIDPSLEKKREILLWMKQLLRAEGIDLYTCCEKELLETLPANSEITGSACIPNRYLRDIFGGRISLRKDTGQRINIGCGCGISIDIGSYHLHPCHHNCIFCYANPSSDKRDETVTAQ